MSTTEKPIYTSRRRFLASASLAALTALNPILATEAIASQEDDQIFRTPEFLLRLLSSILVPDGQLNFTMGRFIVPGMVNRFIAFSIEDQNDYLLRSKPEEIRTAESVLNPLIYRDVTNDPYWIYFSEKFQRFVTIPLSFGNISRISQNDFRSIFSTYSDVLAEAPKRIANKKPVSPFNPKDHQVFVLDTPPAIVPVMESFVQTN